MVEKKRRADEKHMVENEHITLYTGPASFVDNHRITVETSEETVELTADHIFISTGSEPVFPPIDGLKDARNVHTSITLQKQKQLPATLGIIGGGNIGLEFASIYATYGSKVTVFESGEAFVEKEEPEVAEEVKKALEEKSISIFVGTNGETVIAETDSGNQYSFDALLVVTGRKPHTSSLKLMAASRSTIICERRLMGFMPSAMSKARNNLPILQKKTLRLFTTMSQEMARKHWRSGKTCLMPSSLTLPLRGSV
nr:FAD-dependent oxidoreductase [Atopococcus tabaci]